MSGYHLPLLYNSVFSQLSLNGFAAHLKQHPKRQLIQRQSSLLRGQTHDHAESRARRY